MKHRAVVFDLWQTLVVWDYEAAMESYRLMAEHVGVDADRFVELWRATGDRRGTGPLADAIRLVCEGLGVDVAHVEALAERRREAARKVLVPRPGAVETLSELRRRRHALGLISNCSGDVADVWHETRLAEHFDAVVLSCDARVAKPDARIYRLASERLTVEPADCLFVDD